MGKPYSVHRRYKKYIILVGKPEGNRPFGRPRHRKEDIRMDLRETRWEVWT
jgi:hypothetical protein